MSAAGSRPAMPRTLRPTLALPDFTPCRLAKWPCWTCRTNGRSACRDIPQCRSARIGRLAADKAFQGRKLGAALLWDAAKRTLRSEIAVHAVVVDAKNDRAVAFYSHFGFVSLLGHAVRDDPAGGDVAEPLTHASIADMRKTVSDPDGADGRARLARNPRTRPRRTRRPRRRRLPTPRRWPSGPCRGRG